MLKFPDDGKVFSGVSFLEKVENLLTDLGKLHKWSEDWQMFNAQKYKCLHIGYQNDCANYSIGYVDVTNSSYKKYLRAVFKQKLFYQHVESLVI